MIQSKEDLAGFLEADKRALGRSGRPKFNDLIWKYEIALRYSEYYNNRRTSGGTA